MHMKIAASALIALLAQECSEDEASAPAPAPEQAPVKSHVQPVVPVAEAITRPKDPEEGGSDAGPDAEPYVCEPGTDTYYRWYCGWNIPQNAMRVSYKIPESLPISDLATRMSILCIFDQPDPGLPAFAYQVLNDLSLTSAGHVEATCGWGRWPDWGTRCTDVLITLSPKNSCVDKEPAIEECKTYEGRYQNALGPIDGERWAIHKFEHSTLAQLAMIHAAPEERTGGDPPPQLTTIRLGDDGEVAVLCGKVGTPVRSVKMWLGE